MSFPRFLVGMISALVVFAVWSYVATGSLGATLWQTLGCAVLLQVGYFIAVLFMIMRGEKRTAPKRQNVRGQGGSHHLAEKIRQLSNRVRSRHS